MAARGPALAGPRSRRPCRSWCAGSSTRASVTASGSKASRTRRVRSWTVPIRHLGATRLRNRGSGWRRAGSWRPGGGRSPA
eukprot:5398563-Prymnesium_polylepis.3